MKQMEFWKYICLSILGMLGSAGTILADTVFVSNRLGAEGLAALNMAIAVFGLLNGLGMLLGIGGASCYAVQKSQRRYREAGQTFTMALVAAAGVGLMFWALGPACAGSVAGWFDAEPEVQQMCALYLKTILSFAPCFLLNQLFLAFVRNDGNPKLAMAMMAAGSLANVALDYLFLYPLNLGIFGAALATGLAPVIGLGVAAFHWRSAQCGLRLVPIRWQWQALGRIAAPGLAAFTTEVSASIVLLVFNLLVLRCAGTVGVAAYGIVANLALIVLAVFTGISQGLQPLLSIAHGRDDTDLIRRLYRKGIGLAVAVGLGVFALVCVDGSDMVSWFNSQGDETLQRLAEEGLQYYFAGFLFVGYNCLKTSLLSITQRTRPVFLLSVLRGCAGSTLAGCLLAALLGLPGVWLSFPAVELGTMAVGMLWERRQQPRMAGA